MAVGETHFLGFDPTQGFAQLENCPGYDPATVIVWFEAWYFTGYSFGVIADTGIGFTHCYAAFDSLGNVVSIGPRWGGMCCGFASHRQCSLFVKCLSPDEWLAMARASVAGCGLPSPGTIQLSPAFRHDYGAKA